MKRFSKFIQESIELDEKLKASDDMGDWVKDFQDSDAPQFKGKSQKKRQQMAIAAKLSAERNEEVDLDEKYKDPWAAPRKGSSAWHAAQQRKKAERDPEEIKRVNAIGNKNHMVGTAKVTHNEAVEVSHDRYMRSHGKKASGGEGSWMFTHKRMGDANVNDPKEVHSAPRGKFSDAKKSAQQWAKKHGHSTVYVMEEVDLDEAKTDIYHKHMLKALGKSRLPKGHQYTSAIATNGDFVVKDGGGRTVGRIPKGEHNLNEVSDKKLDAYRQKAFADQPAGDDGSDKYRKRKFGRDLAFAKQTGRAKVLATKEEVDLDEVYQETANYLVSEGIELESLNEEQLNELIGAVARGIGRGLKSTVVNKKGNFRFSTAGRADAAQKRANAVKKRSDNIERLRKQRERLAKERERLNNLRKARNNNT